MPSSSLRVAASTGRQGGAVNIAVLVLAVLFAVAGYQEAQRFAKQHGSTPWRWDPWVWAIVMFLSWVIGLILLAIAERQGRRRGAHLDGRREFTRRRRPHRQRRRAHRRGRESNQFVVAERGN